MYASDASAGASTRMHWIAGPAELANPVCDALSTAPSNDGEGPVAASGYVPSAGNRNRASDGDGRAGDVSYATVMSSTRLPNRSRASGASVTWSSIAYTERSGSVAIVSELGSAGTTTKNAPSTSAAPWTTHDTSYSPASVAVTVSVVVAVPAPNGDSASERSKLVTALLNASNATQS